MSSEVDLHIAKTVRDANAHEPREAQPNLFNRIFGETENKVVAAAGLGALAVAAVAMRAPGQRILEQSGNALAKDSAASVALNRESTALAASAGRLIAPAEQVSTPASRSLIATDATYFKSPITHQLKPIGPHPVETPYPEHPYLTGRFNQDGLWVPVREYKDLPPEAKTYVDAMNKSDMPLVRWADVDRFAQDLTRVLRDFTPVPERIAEAPDTYFSSVRQSTMRAVPKGEAGRIAFDREGLLSPEINGFNRRNAAAEVGVQVYDDPGTSMAYFARDSGNVGLRKRDVFRTPEAGTVPEMVGRVVHETGHGLQQQKIARVVADQVGIDRASTASADLPRFKDAFERTMGHEITTNYAQRLLAGWRRDTQPVSLKDKFHSEMLVDAAKNGSNPPELYYDLGNSIRHSNRMLQSIQRGETEGVLKELSDFHGRSLAFHTEKSTPQSVRDLLEARQRGTITDASNIIGTALTNNIETMNRMRQHMWLPYFSRVDEREAWLIQMRAQARAEEFLRTGQ